MRPLRGKLVAANAASGSFVEMDDEVHYRIAAFHRLAPFLMAIPGDADLWMFVTSGGGLTAGRVDADGAIFPYRTVDELHDAHHHTGPLTLIRCEGSLWEPFAAGSSEDPGIERCLYKNVVGSRIVFEETNHALGLRVRQAWASSDEFGWVRTTKLDNLVEKVRSVEMLDGVRNVLPYGATLSLQQQASNLVDAYKRSETDGRTSLAIYSLTSWITDRPEALEMLRANVAWCCGLGVTEVRLSDEAISAFRNGVEAPPSTHLNGERGNYLVRAGLRLQPLETARWHIVLDAGRDQLQIAEIEQKLRQQADLSAHVDAALHAATERLRANVASADGIQRTGRPLSWAHHFANVLFNNMRGGVFDRNYTIERADFERFLWERNKGVAAGSGEFLQGVSTELSSSSLIELARQSGVPDLERLAYEYLPLYFGRRHGDPSRPWNRFSIRARGRDGGRELNYEGNWRDIFQNWEALGTAFPLFLPGMVAKFVNASTVDGFNPYRIGREGVDWELSSPDNPWAHIGYWGDHQIVYLCRLLELMDRHLPDAFDQMLERAIFAYADVPYRLRPYEQILEDPRETIDFDHKLNAEIERRVAQKGSDGRLLLDRDGEVHHATFLEKLLVPLLSKLSNLVPGGGIWMNTQRPEWNDANNALVGNGISVVTLCHLRRYLDFLASRLDGHAGSEIAISENIVGWFSSLEEIFADESSTCDQDPIGEKDRRRVMDRLGRCFSDYRSSVYRGDLGRSEPLSIARVQEFCRAAIRHVESSLHANRRSDGLYHGYNLLEVDSVASAARIRRLPEMLEGQVAVLDCGMLDPVESLALLERLYESRLFRKDQKSFLLYPARGLAKFMERNCVPEEQALEIPLLRELIDAGERPIILRDVEGRLRFAPNLRNARDLRRALDELSNEQRWRESVVRDRTAVLDLYEQVFQHAAYTGRSHVMYAFEGLGCVYWHMVAKLLVATQEEALRARRTGASAEVVEGLVGMYYRIRAGLGPEKTVSEFGAFPTDPYSHTPAQGGARQPGMTGQVKEEVIARMRELGVVVGDGILRFDPFMLGDDEFLQRADVFEYFDVASRPRTIPLDPESLAFTVCQVPVIYRRAGGSTYVEVKGADGVIERHEDSALDRATSREIFERSGRIESVHVFLGMSAPRSPW